MSDITKNDVLEENARLRLAIRRLAERWQGRANRAAAMLNRTRGER